MERLAELEGASQRIAKGITEIRMQEITQESCSIDGPLFACPAEDFVHTIVFPVFLVLRCFPDKDAELRNFGCELQSQLTLAQPPALSTVSVMLRKVS